MKHLNLAMSSVQNIVQHVRLGREILGSTQSIISATQHVKDIAEQIQSDRTVQEMRQLTDSPTSTVSRFRS